MSGRLDHEAWMLRAIELARCGVGLTSPNPPVGAVVVRNGREVGAGFHSRAGQDHAEIKALEQAGSLARNATLYVTLEPCCHYGKTPPCAPAVVAAGIRRVVAALRDPNPEVAGRGLRYLKRAGVEVITGIMQAQARGLIEPFSFFIRTGFPFVILKLAVSADGRIAMPTGESKWITGPVARRRARQLRAEVDAIMVGARTVIRDDPRLTARIKGRRDPLRVIVDGRLRVSPAARVFGGGRRGHAIIVADKQAVLKGGARYLRRGIELMPVVGRGGRVPLRPVLRELAARGVTSLLVEGGGDLAGQLLKERLVCKLVLFIAPRLIGGDGKPMIGELGVAKLKLAPSLERVERVMLGDDLLLQGYLKY